MRKGWYKIKGVQEGDRTVRQQLVGLGPLLAEVKGKRMLDLGCAEGLIARECALAGAVHVTGVEIVADHVTVARQQCDGLPCRFVAINVETLAENILAGGDRALDADIVLALAVLHKLTRPERTAELIAKTAKSLAVIRYPGGSDGTIVDVRSGSRPFDVPKFMRAAGFTLERTERGPFDELTAYFRR